MLTVFNIPQIFSFPRHTYDKTELQRATKTPCNDTRVALDDPAKRWGNPNSRVSGKRRESLIFCPWVFTNLRF